MSETGMQNNLHGTGKVHVLFMIDQLCEPGGAERVMLQTIGLLPKDRFRCSLISFKIDPKLELFSHLPCPCQIFPMRRTYDLGAVRIARSIRGFIRKEKVNIIHTFHETSDLWGGFISRMSNGPVLVSSRRDMGILRTPKHDLGYRFMNSKFDLVLTVSEEVRRFTINKDNIQAERVATLYNGLDTRKMIAPNGNYGYRQSIGIEEEVPLIISVGHVRPIKGIDVLVEAAALVVCELPEAVFLVLGRNSNFDHFRKLEERISQLGIQKNIKFPGETNYVLPALRAADIFLLPSRSEGFSNALIEAMACGLPCVATRVGGNAEAVEEGRSGFLVESEDAKAMAERILRLLRDPTRAKEMGAAGRRIVEEKFTAEVMIQKLIGHYDRILAARRN